MAAIQERSGSFRVLVRRKGITATQTFLSKSAAKLWAAKTEAEVDRGEYQSKLAKSVTAGMLIDDYERELSEHGRLTGTRRSALKMLRGGLGDKSAIELTAEDILNHVKKRTAGAASMNMEIGFLEDVLAFGRLKLPIGNPVGLARPMLRKLRLIAKPKERDRRPSAAELENLYAYWKYPRGYELPMRDIVGFAISSAMRLGEIVALKQSDMDVEKRLVLIRDRKDPQRKDGNNQWIPLLGEAWTIAKRQPKSERLFPYNGDAISRAFLRACEACEIEDLRFHDLRHEGTSRLFEAGYQIQEVALVTGHRDWKSLKRYTNLRPESLHSHHAAKSLTRIKRNRN